MPGLLKSQTPEGKLAPFGIGEGDGNRDRPDPLHEVRPLERLELALVCVGCDRIAGDHPRRAVDGDHSVWTEAVGELLARTVVTAVGKIAWLVPDQLLGERTGAGVLLGRGEPPVHRDQAVVLAL